MYSQYGEDELIGKYIDINKTDGKYIDIGAGNPDINSNTYMLYLKGWKGLCVEPSECYRDGYIDEQGKWWPGFKDLRPRDIFVNEAILEKEGYYNAIGCIFEGSHVYEIYKTYKGANPIKRHAITLKQLLDKYPEFNECDLLSLDTEVTEHRVLATADFTIFKPTLMIIEFQCRKVDNRPNFVPLIKNWYKKVEEIWGNEFYLRKSE